MISAGLPPFPDDILSRCVSKLWASHDYESRDYDMDGSGELGGQIAAVWQRNRVAVVREHGYNLDDYNNDLRSRLCNGEWVCDYCDERFDRPVRAHEGDRVWLICPCCEGVEIEFKVASMNYRAYSMLGLLEVESMEKWAEDNTFVCTLGHPGHPGAEFSSLSYLRGLDA